MRIDPSSTAAAARTLVDETTARDPSVASLGKPSLAVVGLMLAVSAIELLAYIATEVRLSNAIAYGAMRNRSLPPENAADPKLPLETKETTRDGQAKRAQTRSSQARRGQ